MIQNLTQKKLKKTKQAQTFGYRGQQDVESQDKNSASCNCSIRNYSEGIRSEPSVAPRSPVGHRVAEGHTNGHCTHHS